MSAFRFLRQTRALGVVTSAAIMALRLSALAIGLLAVTGSGVMLAAIAVLAAAATLYAIVHTQRLLLLCCRVIASSLWVAAGFTFLLSPLAPVIAAICFIFAAIDVLSPLAQDCRHDRA